MQKAEIVINPKPSSLERLAGWNELPPEEMELVRNKSQSLAEELYLERKSRAAAGKLLVELRAILDPKRMWGDFLLNGYGMSKSTAYNYINEYVMLTAKLPPPFVEVVLELGINFRPEMLEKAHPPKTEDRDKIVSYLETLKKKALRPVLVQDEPPDEVLKNCLNYVFNRWNKLPKRARVRERFKADLIGMMLQAFGSEGSERFTPIKIPDTFIVHRGRPRKKVA
jgi:hypothetical protein